MGNEMINISELTGYEYFTDYYICENGDVYSTKDKSRSIPKKLTGCIDSKGYRYIDVRGANGVRRCPKIHRLVALAYLPNISEKPQINHKDGNKLNNDVTNLEWCTNSENQLHAWANGLQNPNKGLDNHYWTQNNRGIGEPKKVRQLTLDGCLVAEYPSIAEAGRVTSLGASNISRACLGKTKNRISKNYKWEFIEE